MRRGRRSLCAPPVVTRWKRPPSKKKKIDEFAKLNLVLLALASSPRPVLGMEELQLGHAMAGEEEEEEEEGHRKKPEVVLS